MIDATARVDPAARIAEGVSIGPYCIIGPNVAVAENCTLIAHVHVTGHTTIGARTAIYPFTSLGTPPQSVHYHGEPTRLEIGADCDIREGVTMNIGTTARGVTTIGERCFLMANSHVAHNSRIGAHVILANGALLAGHVEIGDRAFISGNCIIHQFTRVGTLALMQGGAAASQDVPPYCLASGLNGLYGLNAVGLRRAGFDADQRMELQRLYRALFRSGMDMGTALRAARAAFSSPAALAMLDFIASSKRGVCRHAHHATPQREVEA